MISRTTAFDFFQLVSASIENDSKLAPFAVANAYLNPSLSRAKAEKFRRNLILSPTFSFVNRSSRALHESPHSYHVFRALVAQKTKMKLFRLIKLLLIFNSLILLAKSFGKKFKSSVMQYSKLGKRRASLGFNSMIVA